jgi:hypothetical protein
MQEKVPYLNCTALDALDGTSLSLSFIEFDLDRELETAADDGLRSMK